jgi:hypothetical protein
MSATELTAEELVVLAECREEWLQLGLNCDPVSLETAGAIIDRLYEAAGVRVPRYKFLTDSPLDCAVASYILEESGLLDISDLFYDNMEEIVRHIRDNPTETVEETAYVFKKNAGVVRSLL